MLAKSNDTMETTSRDDIANEIVTQTFIKQICYLNI